MVLAASIPDIPGRDMSRKTISGSILSNMPSRSSPLSVEYCTSNPGTEEICSTSSFLKQGLSSTTATFNAMILTPQTAGSKSAI